MNRAVIAETQCHTQFELLRRLRDVVVVIDLQGM